VNDERIGKTGRSRARSHASRGLATLLVAVASLAIAGSGVAHAAKPSDQSDTVLATLKIRAEGVEVKAKGDTTYAEGEDGQPLQQGDAIKTDATGRAEIAYTDGSLTRLAESTEFKITKLTDEKGARQTQGTLSVGSTWNRAAKVSESGEFSIKAGGATAAVEGTAFVVTCPAEASATESCMITAVVDDISVESDDWDVTSVTDAQ
jgi:hypothetical protein